MGTKWNMTNDYHKLESIYIKKLLDIVSSYPTNNGYIVWQEVFDNGVAVKNDTVIHVWKGQWEWEMAKVTGKGLRAILSSPWYLNYISYGSDWTKYYLAEPLDFYGSEAQKALDWRRDVHLERVCELGQLNAKALAARE